MRNALLPQVTHLALALGSILSGAVLVEAIFNYPGLGGLLFGAIAGKDYFVIQGIVLMLILSLALALFILDLIYPLIDPRIRYHRSEHSPATPRHPRCRPRSSKARKSRRLRLSTAGWRRPVQHRAARAGAAAWSSDCSSC